MEYPIWIGFNYLWAQLKYDFMLNIQELGHEFNRFLEDSKLSGDPSSLYQPIQYVMSIGGKRIRPVLLLAAYQMYSPQISTAMRAALAVELFHNFTLVHDDIMDKAELRRGQKTVHIKYGIDSAILSGDVMMIYVYSLLGQYDGSVFRKMVRHFTNTAIRICEGQRLDMDFEERKNVTVSEYFQMIEYKTALLLAEALYMGGLLGGGKKRDLMHLFEFGKNIGIAFQIQDDLLDAYGDKSLVGKKTGGDIIQKKKTYLYLKTKELLDPGASAELEDCFYNRETDDETRISRVMHYFNDVNVREYANQVRDAYSQLAVSHLDTIRKPKVEKENLLEFCCNLEQRNH